jgi:sugar/nucleoside kinase (ribokinase family)
MADYYGKSRTNYFKVKNLAKIAELAEKLGCDLVIDPDMNERVADKLPDGRFKIKPRKTVVLLSDEDLDMFYNEDTEEFEDTTKDLQKMLCDGEVCVITHVGSEKHVYFDANAYIITKKDIKFVPLFSDFVCKKLEKICTNKDNLRLWY